MPPEWAASGAKLGFALEVEFTNEPCEYEMTKERLLTGGDDASSLMGNNKLLTVEPLNEPSFVSVTGKETIHVQSGAYGCQIQGLESRQYAFRFFLDFPEGAKRNDVELPAERIYFLSSCWLLNDNDSKSNNSSNNDDDDGTTKQSSSTSPLDRARRRKDKLEQSIQQITSELEEMEQKSSTQNIFQKAASFRESINLVEKRGRLSAQLEELEQTYPLDSSKVIDGPNGITFAKEGVVAVKRLRGAMGTMEQYHWVGTFCFNDFFEDD